MERVRGCDPVPKALTSVGPGERVSHSDVVVGVRVRYLTVLGIRADACEQPAVQDRENIIALDGSNDVLCSPDDLRESFLHLFASETRVVFHARTRQGREHRDLRRIRHGSRELLDEGQSEGRKVAIQCLYSERLVQIFERFVEQH